MVNKGFYQMPIYTSGQLIEMPFNEIDTIGTSEARLDIEPYMIGNSSALILNGYGETGRTPTPADVSIAYYEGEFFIDDPILDYQLINEQDILIQEGVALGYELMASQTAVSVIDGKYTAVGMYAFHEVSIPPPNDYIIGGYVYDGENFIFNFFDDSDLGNINVYTTLNDGLVSTFETDDPKQLHIAITGGVVVINVSTGTLALTPLATQISDFIYCTSSKVLYRGDDASIRDYDDEEYIFEDLPFILTGPSIIYDGQYYYLSGDVTPTNILIRFDSLEGGVYDTLSFSNSYLFGAGNNRLIGGLPE
jgi:hypothetical protein